MKDDATTKIKMLKGSQECLGFGLVSLLAFIGIPFVITAMATREDAPRGFCVFCYFMSVASLVGFPAAVMAMVKAVKVRSTEKKFWNAARPYRIFGTLCAMVGVVSSFIVGAFVAFLMTNANLFGN